MFLLVFLLIFVVGVFVDILVGVLLCFLLCFCCYVSITVHCVVYISSAAQFSAPLLNSPHLVVLKFIFLFQPHSSASWVHVFVCCVLF